MSLAKKYEDECRFMQKQTPLLLLFYIFRPKVSIVVHRKRAIYMFSKYSTRSKTNSGFCIQSMLLISYALVPRKPHRKQLIYLKRMDHCRRMRFEFLENFECRINAVDITVPLFILQQDIILKHALSVTRRKDALYVHMNHLYSA